ncbi:hypothetical protein [Streptomyces sp. NPDC054783]
MIVLCCADDIPDQVHRPHHPVRLSALETFRHGAWDEARTACEELFTCAGHVGACSEEISRTGEQLDDFLPPFSHPARVGVTFGPDRALG